jgi:hypothetical protein
VKDMGVAWGARFELAVQDFKIQHSLAVQGFILFVFVIVISNFLNFVTKTQKKKNLSKLNHLIIEDLFLV